MASYLNELVRSGGVANESVLLMLVGLGEAGKTSLLTAMMSESSKAGVIDVDNRTVGIDIVKWKPEKRGLEFVVYI